MLVPILSPEDRYSSLDERQEKTSGMGVDEARKNKVRGIVVLNLVVDTEGRVENVQAVENPDDSLTRAAMDAVRQWEFRPAQDAKGQPLKVLTTITLRFELK